MNYKENIKNETVEMSPTSSPYSIKTLNQFLEIFKDIKNSLILNNNLEYFSLNFFWDVNLELFQYLKIDRNFFEAFRI